MYRLSRGRLNPANFSLCLSSYMGPNFGPLLGSEAIYSVRAFGNGLTPFVDIEFLSTSTCSFSGVSWDIKTSVSCYDCTLGAGLLLFFGLATCSLSLLSSTAGFLHALDLLFKAAPLAVATNFPSATFLESTLPVKTKPKTMLTKSSLGITLCLMLLMIVTTTRKIGNWSEDVDS